SFKFCYIDNTYSSANTAFDSVKKVMEELETKYPNLKFFWWTMPIMTEGDSKRDQFNTLVRNYCKSNNKFLLDLADIECHSPEGVKQTSKDGYELLYSSYSDDGGHLITSGSLRVAKAYWVILARMCGWK
ncbi:MAG TPA: hypothetical protein PK771_09115, partial [Spirochaetota bacterium]|nr:hypothetical protein [Spirochaetota bacterium]